MGAAAAHHGGFKGSPCGFSGEARSAFLPIASFAPHPPLRGRPARAESCGEETGRAGLGARAVPVLTVWLQESRFLLKASVHSSLP